MEEVWRDIDGFKGLYQVSNTGRIKSLPRMRVSSKNCKRNYLIKGKIIKSRMDRDGYHELNLYENGKPYFKKVHRLVGISFIENPLNLPEINHIDLNKSNNNYLNLEWTDNITNVRHYWNSLKNM